MRDKIAMPQRQCLYYYHGENMTKDYKPRVTVGSIPVDDEPIYKGLFWDAETKKFYRWEDLPKEIKDVD